MPSLQELLAPLGEYAGEDEEKQQEVANELHKKFPAIADVLINRGGASSRKAADAGKKLKDAQADLKKATDRVEELEGLLEEAQSKKPEEVQRLQKELDKTKGQLQQASDALTAEKQERVKDKRGGAVERFKKFTKPGQAGGVQEGYDEDLAAKYGHLITYAEDGTEEVHKIDDPDAVYTPAKGQHALEMLAADAIKKAPAWARLTGVEPGGGQGGGGGGGGGQPSQDDLVRAKAASGSYSDL